jgi:hypothetical protein
MNRRVGPQGDDAPARNGAPTRIDPFRGCLLAGVSIAGWTAQHSAGRNDDNCTEFDRVSDYQDLSFSIWIKGSADMTAPVLPAMAMAATGVRPFRDRYVAWQARDLPARVADAPASLDINTVGRVARFGRASFKGRSNLGPKTLRELAGRLKERLTLPTSLPRPLSRSLPPDDARETVVGAVIARRRNGFRPFAFKSVQVL